VTTEGESPPDKKAVGPRQESRPATSTTTKTESTATLWHFLEVGIDAGYAVGWGDGYDWRDREVQGWLGVSREHLKSPLYAELQERRTLSHDPCRTRCKKCSKCIHSLAYWARGGRDYLGVEAEAALAGAS
jgi:hypothetical protein